MIQLRVVYKSDVENVLLSMSIICLICLIPSYLLTTGFEVGLYHITEFSTQLSHSCIPSQKRLREVSREQTPHLPLLVITQLNHP